MKWDAPEILLSVFIMGGGLCLLGSAYLAREEVVERVERSRGAHETFIKQLDLEIDRLTSLYQSHLRRLASIKSPADVAAIEGLGRTIRGVEHFSLLSLSATSPTDYHLEIREGAGEEAELPVPVFDLQEVPLGREGVLLDAGRLSRRGPGGEGWIDEPGKPLFYWYHRQDRRVAVVLVDAGRVRRAMDAWLLPWLPKAYEPIAVLSKADRLESPDGNILIGTGLEERPQFLLPVATPFGTWQLASWDEVRGVTRFRQPVFYTGVGLAIILFMLGMLAFIHQRRAVRLAKTRVSFANQVSHELRSPLTNILLNVDLAADLVEGAPGATRRLRLIQEEAHRLGRLIDNVLAFSRRENGRAGSLQKMPVSVDEAVDEVSGQFATSLDRLGVETVIERGAGQTILTDRDALIQILANLVSNVEKYAVSGGVLRIESSMADGKVKVRVADRGPGIRSRDGKRVFQPFVRLGEDVNEGASGTGLGLAIARGLAEDLGGRLELRSSEEGACFELTLPAVFIEGEATTTTRTS